MTQEQLGVSKEEVFKRILDKSYDEIEARYPDMTPEENQEARMTDRLGRLIFNHPDKEELAKETGIEKRKLMEIAGATNFAWDDTANRPKIDQKDIESLASTFNTTVEQLKS